MSIVNLTYLESTRAQDHIKEFNEYYEKGETASNSQKYQTAIDCYTKCIEISSEHIDEYMTKYLEIYIDVYYKRGLFYLHIEKYGDSNRDLTKIIEDIDSSFALAYATRGIVFLMYAIKLKININENFKKALTDFEFAVKLDPELEESLKNYIIGCKKELVSPQGHIKEFNEYFENGQTALNSQKYQTAIDCYTKCIEISSEHIDEYMTKYLEIYIDVYYKRGLFYLHIEKYGDSNRDLTKIIEDIDSSFALAYATRGIVFLMYAIKLKININENFKKALTDFEFAVKLDPELEESLKNYIIGCKKELVSPQGHIKEFNEYFENGQTALNSQKYQTAIDCYTKCIEISSEHIDEYMTKYLEIYIDVYYKRGLFYLHIEKYGDSNRDLTKIIEDIDSSFALAYATRGIVFLMYAIKLKININENFKKALTDFEFAVKLDPELEESLSLKELITICKKEMDNN